MKKYRNIVLTIIYAIVIFSIYYFIKEFQIQKPYNLIILITGAALMGIINVAYGKIFCK